MINILGTIVAACIVLAFVPISIVAVCILAASLLAAIAYQWLATGRPSPMVEYERTVERTEDGRTTRRVFRSVNGKTEMTEEVVE